MYGTHEDFSPMATMSDAHREWHTNSGVPMGMPGCPQDACHPPEIEFPEDTESGVRCGNTKAHYGQRAFHATVADVRWCFDAMAEMNYFFSPEPSEPEPSERAIDFGRIQAMSASRFD